MQFSQSIDRHKADIQKRISLLQNKLKAPHLNLYPTSQSNYKQQYKSPQPYIEPKQVTNIRNTLLDRNVKQSRNYLQDNQNRYPQDYLNKQKYQEYQPYKKQNYKNTNFHQGQGKISKNINNYVEQDSYKNPQNNQMYEMMSLILKGQRNLQKQITQLKSDWSREQRQKYYRQQNFEQKNKEKTQQTKQPRRQQQQILNSQIYNNKNSFNFQKDQSKDYQHSFGEIRNLKRETIDLNKKYSNNSSKNQQSILKRNPNRKYTIKDESLNCSDLNLENKGVLKQKIPVKKSNKKQNLIDIASLVHNQKSRNDRLVVNDHRKNEFWRSVQVRIRESQTEYKDSIHRNNKHEHEHLIYTNQLQKKLKQDLISKIYSQCNSCIYK